MFRHLGRSCRLWMPVFAVSLVGCQLIWGIEPIELGSAAPCPFHYDNDAGLLAGMPAPFDGGALACTTSSSPSAAGAGAGGGSTGAGGAGGSGNPPLCSELTPPPIFVYGSNSVVPILQKIGPVLATKGSATVVFQDARSCKAIDAIFDTQVRNKKETACYFPSGGGSSSGACEAVKGQECDPGSEGVLVDIGVSDIFPETCDPKKSSQDPKIKYASGPIQAMIFVTAAKSSQEVISWEAAKATYDPTSSTFASPWNDEAFFFQRVTTSGVQRLLATFFQLDPDKLMRGRSCSSTSDLIEQIQYLDGSKDADKIVGIYDIVNSDVRHKNGENGFKTLAFQPKGGNCGFKPDVSGYDRANVRNGKYVIWSPLHFVRLSDSNPLVKTAVDLILMNSELSELSMNEVFASWVNRGFVPDCAMAVRRDKEMGPLEPKIPLCTCAFEKTLNLATQPGCKSCDPNNPHCDPGFHCDQTYGYCEPNNPSL